MCASFEFWGVMMMYKKGRRISSRDRQLAERIDSVRVFLVEMHHKGHVHELRHIKQHLYKRGVRVRLDDLKLWIDLLANVTESTVNGRRRLKVLEVFGLDQFYDRFNGVERVGYFFNSTPKQLHPKNNAQRIEKQTFTSRKEKAIRNVARVQIAHQKRAKNNPHKGQKPKDKTTRNE
jgi:hypothetical protein